MRCDAMRCDAVVSTAGITQTPITSSPPISSDCCFFGGLSSDCPRRASSLEAKIWEVSKNACTNTSIRHTMVLDTPRTVIRICGGLLDTLETRSIRTFTSNSNPPWAFLSTYGRSLNMAVLIVAAWKLNSSGASIYLLRSLSLSLFLSLSLSLSLLCIYA